MLVEEQGLLKSLNDLVAGFWTMRRLLLKHLVMWSGRLVGSVGPRAMVECLRRLLMGLIDQLALLFLGSGMMVCGIIDIVLSIWIRQRRGRASVLLELR